MRDVVIVGGGPVGVFLAGLLAQRGLDVVVWERRSERSMLSRAIGIHPPSLKAFAGLGVADDVAAAAVKIRQGIARHAGQDLGVVSFAGVSTAFPYVASLPQSRTEAILCHRLAALAPDALRRGVELLSIEGSDPTKFVLRGRSGVAEVVETTRYLVGADGARSMVRERLGVPTAVKHYADTFVMGDFRDDTGDRDDAVIHLEAAGVVESFPLPDGMRRFVIGAAPAAEPTPDSVAELIHARTGTQVDAATNTMLSAFTTRRTLARRLVSGRAVLIGDAAHEISPIGGQGMNLGWLDAAELAPLLAASADGSALRRFEARRLASARRAARQAEANMALGRPMSPARSGLRNAAFRLALATPMQRGLARAYAMAWAD